MSRTLAGIEYLGLPGITRDCKEAVMNLIQCGQKITRAHILTNDHDHCLLLEVEPGRLIAVKSGFGSGYSGEGARGFSFVLELLFRLQVEITEHKVDGQVLERLDDSALTLADVAALDSAKTSIRRRWPDYILEQHERSGEDGNLWGQFRDVMPFSIIDSRLIDLALEFEERPDDCLLKGYRRLEDRVRERTGLDEHGQKLFSQVFLGKPPLLTWTKIDESEIVGRAQLFTGAFMAYRNPRAHRESQESSGELPEFLILNHLFLLEREAVDQAGNLHPVISEPDALRREAEVGKWKRPQKGAAK